MAEFPLFSEDYRPRLKRIIEDQYLNRELGEETPDLFMHAVERRLFRQMPTINLIYIQTLREIDPLVTQDFIVSSENKSKSVSESDSSGKTSSDGKNKSRAVASNNPQVRLAGNADYASGMSDSTAEALSEAKSEEKGRSDTSGEAESESRTKGYSGAPGDLLSSYYASLVNVDDMVIELLAVCFMQVWNTNAPFYIGRFDA